MSVETAVILAAGISRRLYKLSMGKPKSFLKLTLDYTILDIIIETLRTAGIDRVVIVAPHGWSKEFYRIGLLHLSDVVVVENPRHWLENGYSLLLALPFVKEERFIVSMSDHVHHPSSINKFLAAARRDTRLSALVAGDSNASYVDHEEATRILADRDGNILRIGKEVRPYTHIDAGIMVFSKWGLEISAAKSREKQLTISNILTNMLETGMVIKVEDIMGAPWTDMDSPLDYIELVAGPKRIILDAILENLRK